MRCLRKLLWLFLFLSTFVSAQYNAYFQQTFSAVATGSTIVLNSVIASHQISWTVTGGPAGCIVSLDSSPDNSSWTVGGLVAGQTCTSNGSSSISAFISANYARINVTAFSGGASPTITVTYTGWANGLAVGNFSGSSQVIMPNGSTSVTGLNFTSNAANTGFFESAAATIGFVSIGSHAIDFEAVHLGLKSLADVAWSSGTAANGVKDTNVSRSAADVLAVGNGTQGDTTGRVKAAGYMSVGTTFTSNAGCTESALVGGATAGKFTVGVSTACTIIITMGNAATSPNGWACYAYDQTTVPTVAIRQTASTATTASLLMTVTTNDVVSFGCIGY